MFNPEISIDIIRYASFVMMLSIIVMLMKDMLLPLSYIAIQIWINFHVFLFYEVAIPLNMILLFFIINIDNLLLHVIKDIVQHIRE